MSQDAGEMPSDDPRSGLDEEHLVDAADERIEDVEAESGLMLRRGAPHLAIRRLRRIPVEPARGAGHAANRSRRRWLSA